MIINRLLDGQRVRLVCAANGWAMVRYADAPEAAAPFVLAWATWDGLAAAPHPFAMPRDAQTVHTAQAAQVVHELAHALAATDGHPVRTIPPVAVRGERLGAVAFVFVTTFAASFTATFGTIAAVLI